MTTTWRPLASSIVAPSDGFWLRKGTELLKSDRNRSPQRSGGNVRDQREIRRIPNCICGGTAHQSFLVRYRTSGGPPAVEMLGRRAADLIAIASSRPEIRAVERSVVDRFGDVIALDAFAGD